MIVRRLAAATLLSLSLDSAPPEGRFAFVPAKSDDIEAAIHTATAKMNFLIRGIARGRLRKTNPPAQEVRITHADGSLRVQFDQTKAIEGRPDDVAFDWQREDGETFKVRLAVHGDTIVQTFIAPDGERINRFVPHAHPDTIDLRVTISSPRLPQPLNYTLVYAR